MKHIRLATEDEVKSIAEQADLTPRSTVFATDNAKGSSTLAILRNSFGLDPVLWGSDTTIGEKTRFIWGMEERMIGAGIDAYYFNIKDSEDTLTWREHVIKWGAGIISGPDLRFKKVLIR